MNEVEARLVTGYPASKTRRPLFDGWQRHRTAVRAIVPFIAQWVGGGFVEDKDDPSDIDLCTLLDGPTLDALPVPALSALTQLVTPVAKGLFGSDSYPIVVYPQGHPAYDAYLRMRGYWDDWWGQTRAKQSKGYLEVS